MPAGLLWIWIDGIGNVQCSDCTLVQRADLSAEHSDILRWSLPMIAVNNPALTVHVHRQTASGIVYCVTARFV